MEDAVAESGLARWADALPRPVAFVFSGGANHGALQVGQLQALAAAGITPDMVVAVSAGAFNGVMLAQHRGDVRVAAAELDRVWRGLTRQHIFPGGLHEQAWRIVTGRSVFPSSGLRKLLADELLVSEFAELDVPLGVLATEVLHGKPRLFTEGRLDQAVLASSAIPGLLPDVTIRGTTYWDGGINSNVPLRAAMKQGAASLVVLDVHGGCPLDEVPKGVPFVVSSAQSLAIRQRVLVEAPVVAEEVPMLYLPRPCFREKKALDFETPLGLIGTTFEVCRDFLATSPIPTVDSPTGGPHTHEPSMLDEDVTTERA